MLHYFAIRSLNSETIMSNADESNSIFAGPPGPAVIKANAMVSSVCDPSPPAADTVTIVQQPIAPPCSIPTFHNDQANFSQ